MRVLNDLILLFWLAALLRTVVNLLSAPRLRAMLPKTTPLVSIIVPARDEEEMIERAVRGFLGQTYPEIEVIVVNDRSTDGTGAILQGLAAEDGRLIVIDGEEPQPGWLGKPWALEQGSRRARGELLLFVDADVIYAPETVAAGVAYLERRDVSMIAFLPHIEMHGVWDHVVMPNLAMTVFMMLPSWLANRSRSALLAVGGGTGNFVRRDAYEAAGRHEALKDAVVDDVALARLVRKSGGRTEGVRAEAFVSVRMYRGLAAIVEGFTKNGFAVLGRSYLVLAVALVFSIVVHLYPFALAATGDGIGLATVAAITLTRVILFAALGYGITAAIFGHVPMIVIWMWIFIRSAWYTGIHRQLTWRGRTYDARRTRFGAD
jgi:cellulose synthase/poly-beta-1,6-N-acetylglucosamine synthase-like glycosyltransferase